MKPENKFYIIPVNYQIEDKDKRFMANAFEDKVFKKIVKELKYKIEHELLNININYSHFEKLRKIENMLAGNSSSYKEELIELYIHMKYSILNPEFWYLEDRVDLYSVFDLLLEKNIINYILTHRRLKDYHRFMIINEVNNMFFFKGESALRLMEPEFRRIKELNYMKHYLDNYGAWPFIVVIDKALYLSVRAKRPVPNPTPRKKDYSDLM